MTSLRASKLLRPCFAASLQWSGPGCFSTTDGGSRDTLGCDGSMLHSGDLFEVPQAGLEWIRLITVDKIDQICDSYVMVER